MPQKVVKVDQSSSSHHAQNMVDLFPVGRYRPTRDDDLLIHPESASPAQQTSSNNSSNCRNLQKLQENHHHSHNSPHQHDHHDSSPSSDNHQSDQNLSAPIYYQERNQSVEIPEKTICINMRQKKHGDAAPKIPSSSSSSSSSASCHPPPVTNPLTHSRKITQPGVTSNSNKGRTSSVSSSSSGAFFSLPPLTFNSHHLHLKNNSSTHPHKSIISSSDNSSKQQTTKSNQTMDSVMIMEHDHQMACNGNMIMSNGHHPDRFRDDMSSSSDGQAPLRLTWTDLTYTLNETKWSADGYRISRTSDQKVILKPQSGELLGGTITALMGPSGAGKSTLLSCITGRYTKGLNGSINVYYPKSAGKKKNRNMTIAYVPQKDYLFPQFTVHETLIFASKMKNKGKDHVKEALKVIRALNLESCTDVKISGCSGGETKRVSIGVELISDPNILVLDEPTSGLDSSNAVKIIKLLRDLAEAPSSSSSASSGSFHAPAIVATIHQPNHRIFTDFSRIYLLSRDGHNIYFGSPHGLVNYFNSHSIRQPDFSSPADYAIEVANGSYGSEVFPKLAEEQLRRSELEATTNAFLSLTSSDVCKVVPIQKVINKMRGRPMPGMYQTFLLMTRSIQASCFKSPQLLFKILVNIIIACLISLLWSDPTGVEDGCWQSSQFKDAMASGGKDSARNAYLDKITKITANCNLLFSTCIYFMLVYSIGTVLVIPLEILTVVKEMSNSWYKVSSYFVAKTIADLPSVIVTIFCLEAVCWLATEQVAEFWRFMSAYSLSVLMGIVCESVGVLMGIVLSYDLVSATLITMASSFPVLMFSGFLIKVADIPWYFKPMTYVSYARYNFEGILTSVYGFDRCSEQGPLTEDFMKDLAASQNPIEFISTLWHGFNVTSSDAKIYAPVLGVPQEHLESVINGTIDFLGSDPLDDSSDSLSSTYSEPSYVMSYFKLSDDNLKNSFISLLTIVCILKIAIFLLLSFKTRKTQ